MDICLVFVDTGKKDVVQLYMADTVGTLRTKALDTIRRSDGLTPPELQLSIPPEFPLRDDTVLLSSLVLAQGQEVEVRICHTRMACPLDYDPHGKLQAMCIALSPSGRWCAVGLTNLIEVFSTETGEHAGEIHSNNGLIVSLAFSPCSQWLFSAGKKVERDVGGLLQCNFRRRTHHRTLIPGLSVYIVRVSLCGRWVLSQTFDKIQLHDFSTGNILKEMGVNREGLSLNHTQITTDSQWVVSCNAEGVHLWGTTTDEEHCIQFSGAESVAVSPCSKEAYAGGRDGALGVIDLRHLSLKSNAYLSEDSIEALVPSSCGRWVFMRASQQLLVLDLSTGVTHGAGESHGWSPVLVSPCSKYLLYFSQQKSVYVRSTTFASNGTES